MNTNGKDVNEEDSDVIFAAMNIVADGIDEPKKTVYFVKALNVFLLNPKYKPIEKMLYLALRCYAGKSMMCYPGQTRLAKELNISRMSLSTNLTRLQKIGGVYILNQIEENNRKTSNLYFVADLNETTGDFLQNDMMRLAKTFPNPYIHIKYK